MSILYQKRGILIWVYNLKERKIMFELERELSNLNFVLILVIYFFIIYHFEILITRSVK